MLLIGQALAGPFVAGAPTIGMQAAPHQPFVQLSESLLVGPTIASFTRVEGGSPLTYTPSGWAGIGVTAQLGVTGMAVPAEDRGWFGARSLAIGIWALFEADDVMVHGFGLTAGYSPKPGLFELIAHEGDTHAGLSYRLQVPIRSFQVGFELDTGINGVDVLHATASPWASLRTGPVDWHLRGMLGLQHLAAVSGGAGLVVGGLTIAGTAHLVVPTRLGDPHLLPQLTVRYGWDWKKRSQRPENGWGEAIGG